MNSTAHRPANPLAVFLAGLQAGMIGICWMLAWLGLSAMGQRRSFWTAENLMASVFHGGGAIRRGFGFSTLSGIALYLLVYSLLGAGFAVAARNRFTSLGTVLVGVLFSVGWYCLWFRALGQTAMPLVWLLHAESSTAFGHVMFGALLARFPAYLPKPEQAKAEQPSAEVPAAEQGNPLPDGRGSDGERNPLPTPGGYPGCGSDGEQPPAAAPADDVVPPRPDLN